MCYDLLHFARVFVCVCTRGPYLALAPSRPAIQICLVFPLHQTCPVSYYVSSPKPQRITSPSLPFLFGGSYSILLPFFLPFLPSTRCIFMSLNAFLHPLWSCSTPSTTSVCILFRFRCIDMRCSFRRRSFRRFAIFFNPFRFFLPNPHHPSIGCFSFHYPPHFHTRPHLAGMILFFIICLTSAFLSFCSSSHLTTALGFFAERMHMLRAGCCVS